MFYKKQGHSYSSLTQDEKPTEKANVFAWLSFAPKKVLAALLLSNTITLCLASFLAYHIGYFRSSVTHISADLIISPAGDIVRNIGPRPYDGEIFQTNKYRATLGQLGGGVRVLRLHEEEVRNIGSTNDDPFRPLHIIPDDEGGYAGVLEVFHLLHCLGRLRESQFYNWDHYQQTPFWQVPLDIAAEHNEHCFDAIRQNLMCYADVTPLVLFDPVRTPSVQLPVPNFSSIHTCRNFDEILDWNNNNPRSLTWEQVGNASTHKPDAENHGHS
ncbi:hypothetical protein N431DRAFT_505168 [Stipitochalara longipes BDJ]|nr:hypothetical protein N431DRAFT_505168 [Stipitochalara longipes BDJ]